MVEVHAGKEFEMQRHETEKMLTEIEGLFDQVSGIIAGSEFGQDAVKKARAVCEHARQAIAEKHMADLVEVSEALTRTLNMFRGVVSKTNAD